MINPELSYRSFGIDVKAVKKDERETELSFSSEEPYMRFYGNEILLHGPSNVDMSRLSMASVLFNHNPNIIIGPVKSATIQDKRGKASIGFDDTADGNLALERVRSGSLKGVSVGYSIDKYRRLQEDEEWRGYKGPALIATRWTPHEITLTPIPADASVGVGRSIIDDIANEAKTPNEEKTMEREEILKLIDESVNKGMRDMVPDIVRGIQDKTAEAKEPKMLVTVTELQEIRSRAAAIGPAAVELVTEQALKGKDAITLERSLTDSARQTFKPDAQDPGDQDPGKKVQSIEKIDDDDFLRALTGADDRISFQRKEVA